MSCPDCSFCDAGGLAQEVLSCLGLSVQALSTNGQEALSNIASTARSLQLRGCEQYMFLTALIQLAGQQHELLSAQVSLHASDVLKVFTTKQV